jgi:hypothetical protein
MLSIAIVSIIFGFCMYVCKHTTNFDREILDISKRRDNDENV